MPAKKKAAGSVISLTRLGDSELSIPIVGLTPVIPHAWSEESRRMMTGHVLQCGRFVPLWQVTVCLLALWQFWFR